ncbi:unnamed protein product [Moneuplotes crassus]|uniref:Nuclear speckle splicing regulatory protein 1 N-terminal domain-containing protein n=1 Tax=Euplotes crassus TaxID=5936 RepID=A0AAD1XM09_EUPCR|nr:unnamed protein product [Moneuplotes crassus]
MNFKLNLNLNTSANQAKKPAPLPGSTGENKAPKKLAIFSAAMEEEESVDAPMSHRDLVNMQILDASKRQERQALKLQAQAIADGVDYDIDTHLKDEKDEPDEVQLPQKQTMQGKSKYLGQLLKARERRERDKFMATEKVEKKERVREEGEFGDKEKFITESYQRQLELNKKEQMIHEIEDKMNSSKTLSNTGMTGFFNKMLGEKSKDSADIREKAKELVSQRTNINAELDEKESAREKERKIKEDKKKVAIRKEMEEILKAKLGKKEPTQGVKRKQKEVEKLKEETPEEKKERIKKEREEKIRAAKERLKKRKENK